MNFWKPNESIPKDHLHVFGFKFLRVGEEISGQQCMQDVLSSQHRRTAQKRWRTSFQLRCQCRWNVRFPPLLLIPCHFQDVVLSCLMFPLKRGIDHLMIFLLSVVLVVSQEILKRSFLRIMYITLQPRFRPCKSFSGITFLIPWKLLLLLITIHGIEFDPWLSNARISRESIET